MIEWATMAEVARLFGWSESYARKLAHPRRHGQLGRAPGMPILACFGLPM